MKRKFNAANVPGLIPLDSVSVASPCHADWDAMHGDERARFCPSCSKNVYNLSAMTSNEAQLLLQEKEGRLCVRYFQREDGTMLTQDCPVGAAALKQSSPSFALWAGVASLVLLAGALLSPSFLSNAQAQPEPKSSETPAQTASPTPTPEATPTPVFSPEPPGVVMMGDFAPAPHPTTAPTPAPSATPEPTPIFETLGEIAATIRATPAPGATPAPTPTKAPTIAPKAKNAPREGRMLMGRIAVPQPPKPTPTPQPAPVAMMGEIAPQQPAPPTPKKPKTQGNKRR